MTSAGRRNLFAGAAWLAAVALAVVSLVLLVLGSAGIAGADAPPWLVAALYLANLPLPTVGALVTVRRPGNPIGPLLLVAGLSVFVWFSSSAYATFALSMKPDLPGGAIAIWVSGWAPFPYGYAVLNLVPLLYPDGRFLSHRWRVIGWLVVALCIAQSLGVAFGRPVLQTGTSVGTSAPNPFAVAALAPLDVLLTQTLGVPFGFTLLVIAWAAVVVRFRRSRDIERLQIKWFLYAVGVVLLSFAILFPLAFLGNAISSEIFFFTFTFTFMLIPISVGLAIMRYRLYEIDRLINRTVVYAVTTGTVGLAFFAGVVVLQALLRPITSGSELAVAASTLASLALFQPLRRRVQEGVDRRFYRSRYDAARTLDAFGGRLRDEVDLDSVRAELLDAVGDALSPAHASVWLR